jgi:peptidase E
LRDAWRAGVVLCGGSAGSLCWFTEAVSAFHEGAPRRLEGLGFLPWSNAVHYGVEPGRRAAFRQAIRSGMAPGYGVGDGAALHFIGTELEEVICSRQGAHAFYVSADARGHVVERELPARCLGPAESDGPVAPGATARGESGLSDGPPLARAV